MGNDESLKVRLQRDTLASVDGLQLLSNSKNAVSSTYFVPFVKFVDFLSLQLRGEAFCCEFLILARC